LWGWASLSPFSTIYIIWGAIVQLLFLSSTLFIKVKIVDENDFTMLSHPLIIIILL
jgi:hypothetical protein